MSRVVGIASVLVDLVLEVPVLPPRGGDVLATAVHRHVGGGRNALSAARRLGVPAAYAGAHGTGPNGDLVRAALAADDVDVLLPVDTRDDTGFCVGLVEPDAERTYVTRPGAEARPDAAELAAVRLRERDLLYVSGYDLAYPEAGPVVAPWVTAAPVPARVLLDPGPLVGEIPEALLAPVLARVDVLSLNVRELELLGEQRLAALPAAAALVVRDGARGAGIRDPWTAHVVPAPAPSVVAVDTSGAGDVHCGALLAGLASGLPLRDAVARANRAAAWSVTRPGPAQGPTPAQLARPDPWRPYAPAGPRGGAP